MLHILADRQEYTKTLVFVASKRIADRLHVTLEERFGSEIGLIHANKSQNYRTRSIQDFEQGRTRVLVTTDVMARGLDLDKISHVINFDTPTFPENYMHRIGRTGRATQLGKTLLLFTEKEAQYKEAIEALMDYKIPMEEFPAEVPIDFELAPEERPIDPNAAIPAHKVSDRGPAFHEKSKKNQKTNGLGGGAKRKLELARKHKKPMTRGDKFAGRGKG